MGRRLFTVAWATTYGVASALSLMLAVAAAVLRSRSYSRPAGGEDRLSRVVRGERYELRSERGRLVLYRPPAEAPGRAQPAAADLVGAVSSAQLTWAVERMVRNADTGTVHEPFGPAVYSAGCPEPQYDSPAEALWLACPNAPRRDGVAKLTPAELVPPLLRALEDSDKFVAAHWFLTEALDGGGNRRSAFGFQRLPDEISFVRHLNGLRVELQLEEPRWFEDGSYGDLYEVQPCSARADPAQFPALRDAWHRRLGVPIGSAAYWHVVAAGMILPAAWCAAAARRWMRGRAGRRAGLCRRCGYDLRASPGRCPECGTPAKGAA